MDGLRKDNPVIDYLVDSEYVVFIARVGQYAGAVIAHGLLGAYTAGRIAADQVGSRDEGILVIDFSVVFNGVGGDAGVDGTISAGGDCGGHVDLVVGRVGGGEGLCRFQDKKQVQLHHLK